MIFDGADKEIRESKPKDLQFRAGGMERTVTAAVTNKQLTTVTKKPPIPLGIAQIPYYCGGRI
jgi:hypothetical protein